MRNVLVWSITGIVLATALLVTSQIAQSAFAFTISSKSGAFASTDIGGGGKPVAVGPPGVHGPGIIVKPGSAVAVTSGCPLGKTGAFTQSNGLVCAP